MKNVLNKCMKNLLKLNNNLAIYLPVKKLLFTIKILLFFSLVTIEQETLSDVYDRICEIIDREETVDHAWIPSKEKI